MGKKKFDRNNSVRFNLIAGPIKDGKPTTIFKPVDTQNSNISKKQRKKLITSFSDYDMITINGRQMGADEIPAFVLQQIKGRSDLIINQMKEQEEEIQDEYEIMEGKEDDAEYDEYSSYSEEEIIEELEDEDKESGDEQWEDEEDDEEDMDVIDVDQKKKEKFAHKKQEFPSLEELSAVNIQGKQYMLTKNQINMLDVLIPENYEQMDFGGLEFQKFNEDGLPLKDKQKYEKYMFKDDKTLAIVDSYEYTPETPVDQFDSDLKHSEIVKDKEIKEVQQALDYNGQEQAYEEMEDDFFSKMIQAELAEKPKKQKVVQKKQQNKPKVIKNVKENKQILQNIAKSRKQIDEELEKALYNFQHNIQQKKDNNKQEESSQEEEEVSYNNYSMNFSQIQKRQEYQGRDGQLDWRCLTKQQKRDYMKTKVIREGYDELRQREIQQKMKGKSNITPEQLHLKQLVEKITYDEDHVMQNSLAKDLEQKVDIDAEESYEEESLSDEDDIISFHQKTSIIATNLSVIEQPRKERPKKKKNQTDEESSKSFSIIKVVPEQRNKNETAQQRKIRKMKLKELKKQKKEQKKQFAQKFDMMKKQTMKQVNTTNPLNKVSYVKIY